MPKNIAYFSTLAPAFIFDVLGLMRTRSRCQCGVLAASRLETTPHHALTLPHTPCRKTIHFICADLFLRLLIRFFILSTIRRAICIVVCGLVNSVLLFGIFVLLAFNEVGGPTREGLIDNFIGSFVGSMFGLLFAFAEVAIGLKADEDCVGFGDGDMRHVDAGFLEGFDKPAEVVCGWSVVPRQWAQTVTSLSATITYKQKVNKNLLSLPSLILINPAALTRAPCRKLLC